MIPGTCPDCGTIRPLPDYLKDAEARAALAAALDCPAGLARQIVPYLALHAPAQRCIQSGKLTRLLRELASLLGAGTVARRGVEYAAPHDLWAGAFELVQSAQSAGTLTLPLDGHGYLTECAWRLASKRVGGGQGAGADAPIHASQTPAPEAAVAPVADWGQRRAAGLSHIGGLAKAIITARQETPSSPHDAPSASNEQG